MQPLPIVVRRLWQAAGLATGVLGGAVLGGIEVALRLGLEVAVPPAVVPLAVGLLGAGIGWWAGSVLYRSWRFELTDEWIQARWGVLIHHTATIPRNRVQTLTSENGPVDRLLGLTSVTVHTAGAGAPNLSIPHLEDGTVDWLRDELARGNER